MGRGWRSVVLAVSCVGLFAGPIGAESTDCDRGCLRRVLDAYFAALFVHDPSKAPLAGSVRATENGAAVAVGEGIWKSADAYGQIQRRFFDPKDGQAAYFGEITEGTGPSIVSLRIRVDKQRIVESEWTVARKSDGNLFSIDELRATPPPPDTPLPLSERAPRASMIAAANAYFDGAQTHDGSKIPHISGCQRLENGFKVTDRAPNAAPLGAPAGANGASPTSGELHFGDCASGFDAFVKMIASASHRRFPLVDEEVGVVMGTTIFQRPPGSTRKRNLLTEYFYQRNAKISAIYAAMYYLDPAAPDSSGWD